MQSLDAYSTHKNVILRSLIQIISSLGYLIKAARPRQWIKNIFVFTALAFSEERLWLHPDKLIISGLAFVLFCMAASAIYLLNDLVDIEKDRAHPRKRNRPLASGKLSPAVAVVALVLLVGFTLPAAWFLDPDGGLALTLVVYMLVQGGLYSYWLKHIVVMDILVIAAGFILRTLAGAAVLNIVITPWLMVCMGLLALFLGVGKRRHELVLLSNGAGEHRRILKEYSVAMLDQMVAIVTASIIMAYSMTTFSAPVAPLKPYPVLMWTIPFVVYSIFRYIYLIYQKDGGGSPEDLLLSDRPLLFSVALWGSSVLLILFFFRHG